MNIKNLFQRKQQGGEQQTEQAAPQPLRIEGTTPAPLTPEPDDAELAAQALLEALCEECRVKSEKLAAAHRKRHRGRKGTDPTHSTSEHSAEANSQLSTLNSQLPEERGSAYYRHLAHKIRQAREAQRLRVVRFLAFCEQELRKPHLPAYGDGSLGLLEAELYKRLDIVEHEGGELKRRWQHCLATVTVRLMQATHHEDAEPSPTTDGAD